MMRIEQARYVLPGIQGRHSSTGRHKIPPGTVSIPGHVPPPSGNGRDAGA
jgi:hypothetical protein